MYSNKIAQSNLGTGRIATHVLDGRVTSKMAPQSEGWSLLAPQMNSLVNVTEQLG